MRLIKANTVSLSGITPPASKAGSSTAAAQAPLPAAASQKSRLKDAGTLLSEGTFSEKYELGAKLGKGSFGEVLRATRKKDGKACVLPALSLRALFSHQPKYPNAIAALLSK